jgi:hypothetical protein
VEKTDAAARVDAAQAAGFTAEDQQRVDLRKRGDARFDLPEIALDD